MVFKIPFINNKQSETIPEYSGENTPEHIAIIMDGNGRWAKNKGLLRTAGHKEGLATLVKIVKTAVNCQVKMLTLYTFSTENWKRPKAEVEFILRLPKQLLEVYLPDLIANNVRINVIGDMDDLPKYTLDAIQYAIDRTANNTGLELNFALNYGGRDEILKAIKDMYADVKDTKLSMDEVNEQIFSKYLYTAKMPEPDLLIRTGGEKRLSNFLLWQLAYTEFWFTDVLWPEFSEADFLHAIDQYQQRNRRYGGLSN